MKKKGFTLIELLVVIAIIAMLLAILMPALNKVKRLAQRLICSTNLKGLGTAMMVYANDFEDEYPVAGAGNAGVNEAREWGSRTSDWQLGPDIDWTTSGDITVGASLFLLVREADVSTKSFVCKSSDQKAYEGQLPASAPDYELVELVDFGSWSLDNCGPRGCVSYSYQQPYQISTAWSPQSASPIGAAGNALMADKNPWLDPKLVHQTPNPDGSDWEGLVDLFPAGGDWDTTTVPDKWEMQVTNSYPHNREGQNVLFNDGHSEFLKRSDVGYENDNIYTPWNTNPEVEDITGFGPTGIGSGAPKSNVDNVLVNDDEEDSASW